MRLLPLLMTFLFLVSCGKNGGSSSSPSAGPVAGGDAQLEESEPTCSADSCTNTITVDGTTVDLLDSVIDVPAQISGTQIAFTAAKASVAEGDRISCKTEVAAGEVYSYSISGHKLMLQTNSGQYTMSRLNEDGDGLIGTWLWKGTGPDGMHVIRTMGVVSNSRVILKTHCEL